ncbi:MAG: radical SAM protein [Deltaproteobacteria bacterium]|nr:radical SAM protein [Deltaproteobacteria bacterium]
MTRLCNNSCGHCYNAWRAPELQYPLDKNGEMTTAEIKWTILKLMEDLPLTTVVLSGGEPTLRTDLPDIVQFIRSQGLAVQIITNGTNLTEALVDATVSGSSYQISLLSWRREVHDRLSGHPGAWDALIDGMTNVHLAGGHLIAVFVATRQNYADIGPTAHLAMMLGADSLLYNRINVGAANLHHSEELFLTPTMVEENLRVLDEISSATGFPVSTGVVIEPCMVDIARYPHIRFNWCSLAGEQSTLIVDPAGNFRVCEHSSVVLGNVRRDSVRDIYEHHTYISAFRTTWPMECSNCYNPLKESCRGGCKAAAEQAYGTFERVDPFVRLRQ